MVNQDDDAQTIRSWEPAEVTLPNGRALRLKIKRLDIGESAEFDQLFARALHRDSDRVLLARKPGDELQRDVTSALSTADLDRFHADLAALERRALAKINAVETIATDAIATLRRVLTTAQPTERYVLSDDEIQRRRLLELSDSERKSYDLLTVRDNEAFNACATHALTRFVRVVPRQLKWEDEDSGHVVDVLTGADLAKCIGAQGNVILAILLLIRHKNRLTDDEKKDFGSLSSSRTSSADSDPTASGDSPKGSAASAAP